jgi:hypothetical protein
MTFEFIVAVGAAAAAAAVAVATSIGLGCRLPVLMAHACCVHAAVFCERVV